MPKVVEEKKEEETPLPSYQERKSLMEIIFERETPLTFILLSLILLWIGIIFGLMGSSSQTFYIVGRILYSLGGIFLLFFTIGLSIMNKTLSYVVRTALVVFAIAVLQKDGEKASLFKAGMNRRNVY